MEYSEYLKLRPLAEAIVHSIYGKLPFIQEINKIGDIIFIIKQYYMEHSDYHGLTVFEYMEDFDNAELDVYERRDQLLTAVLQYNREYGTKLDPEKTFRNYIRIQIKRQHDGI